MKQALIITLICVSFISASVLGDLASSLDAGEWAELNTSGLTRDFLIVGNKTILEYAAQGQWDADTRQVLFIGSGHNCPYKFIKYSEATNTWTSGLLPDHCMTIGHVNGGCEVHSYYYSTMDRANGLFFFWVNKRIHAYDIAANSWSVYSSQSNIGTNYCGMEYFPEMNEFIWIGAWRGNQRYRISTNSWMSLGQETATIGAYVVYSPVHKCVLFSGGSGNRDVFKVTTTGTSQVSTSPAASGTHSSINTIDPVTGDMLVYYPSGNFHVYDVEDNQWRQLPTPPAGLRSYDLVNQGGFGVSVNTYGINMFVSNAPHVYIYKHSGTSGVSAGVRDTEKDLAINVTPNPFTSAVCVSIAGRRGGSRPAPTSDIRVYATNGRLIDRVKMQSGRAHWDAGHLPQGVYIVRATMGNKTVSRRILKSK